LKVVQHRRVFSGRGARERAHDYLSSGGIGSTFYGAKQAVVMAALPWLTTAGNRIVSVEDGATVVLRGINRSGLEYADSVAGDFIAGARMSFSEIEEIVLGWGARVLRIPFSQSRVVDAATSAAYLHALDTVIEWTASCGAYVLLDLQWLDPAVSYGSTSDGSLNRIAPLPSAESGQMWRVLAERYQNTPAVLFDIYNEPHSRLPGDPHVPMAVRPDGSEYALTRGRVTARVWRDVAARLIRDIKEVHPRALTFVSGVSWGYDLRGVPFGRADEIRPEGIVYGAHVYPSSMFERGGGRAAHGPLAWDRAFGSIAADVPVCVAEFGGGAEDLEWGRRLLDYLEARHIGWLAWSWSDAPRLVTIEEPKRPTPFGTLVRAALGSAAVT
jgi:endoglucanase